MYKWSANTLPWFHMENKSQTNARTEKEYSSLTSPPVSLGFKWICKFLGVQYEVKVKLSEETRPSICDLVLATNILSKFSTGILYKRF